MTTSLLASFQDAPPLAGQPAPATTALPGTADPAAAPRSGGDMGGVIWMFLPVLAIMIFISVMGGRREKKKRAALMSSMKKHDEVQTAGGILGSVVEIKDDTVVLKVDENSNVRMTFTKSAIVQIVSPARDAQGIKA